MDLRLLCLPLFLSGDVLDYCSRNNDSRSKNHPSRKYLRSREPIDRREIAVAFRLFFFFFFLFFFFLLLIERKDSARRFD